MSSRTVTVAKCRDCGVKILTGLNRDWIAETIRLDYQAIDAVGEALAVLTGRVTYNLRPIGGRSHGRQMDERSSATIRNSSGYLPVHAEHVCGQPLPPKAHGVATPFNELPVTF